MKRSTDRILTTHTGSLPRPTDLVDLIRAREEGQPVDAAAFTARVRSAVADVVRKQVETGIDVVSDGEMGKPSFATYVTQSASAAPTRSAGCSPTVRRFGSGRRPIPPPA
jgi:5-methyltetrahydropteroyltriglutamate--homocysteine methyltransferase